MNDLFGRLVESVGVERLFGIGRGLMLLGVGWLAAHLASRAIGRLIAPRLKTHNAFLLRRATFFVIFSIFLAAALYEVGFKLGLLFGAAGVVTIAVGIAAKSAASNIISGLFLIAEEPFEIGDSIQVGSTSGEVQAIDLLSVKLKTFDGVFVRIPNEDLIGSEIRNTSRLPLRRVDLLIGVAQDTDPEELRAVLLEVAGRQRTVLNEPAPDLVGLGLGETTVDFRFSVWAARENYQNLRTALYFEIPRTLAAAGIEIPVPTRRIRIEGDSRSGLNE